MQLYSWLKNPTGFEIGLKLLDKYCPGKHITFKNHARKFGENSFYKAKLYKIIKEINRAEVVEEENKEATKALRPSPRRNLKITREELPEVLQELWDTRLALFKQAAYYHGRFLLLSPSQQEAAVNMIIINRERINEIWEQLDYYKINQQQMPAKKAIGQDDYFVVLRRLNTLRTYKSKYRRAPEKWARYQEEFDQVTNIVNAGKNKN